jgi:hypothetical protein
MSVSAHLKETAADAEVKTRLWSATERELLGFAERHALARSPKQKADNDVQADVIEAVKRRGYPVSVVRQVSRLIGAISRAESAKKTSPDRILELSERKRQALRDYRCQIGLGFQEGRVVW